MSPIIVHPIHPTRPIDDPAVDPADRNHANQYAEFLAECERVGVPADVAARARERSAAFGTKWWSGIQRAAAAPGKDEKGKPAAPPVVVVGKEKDETGEQEQEEELAPHDDDDAPTRPRATTEAKVLDGSSSSSSSSSHHRPTATTPPPTPTPTPSLLPLPRDVAASAQSLLLATKAETLDALRTSLGDTTNPRFLASLGALSSLYAGMQSQGRRDPAREHGLFEGTWLTLSRPNFRDCLGQNRRGDFLYTLGRMSFDMFRPTELKCSIQRVVSRTRRVGSTGGVDGDDAVPENVPRGLRREMEDLHEATRRSGTVDGTAGGGSGSSGSGSSSPVLRTYDIEVEFSIEPKGEGCEPGSGGGDSGGGGDDCDSSSTTSTERGEEEESGATYRAPSKPLRAKMTSRGYMLPDPDDPMRLTVWFTGGTVAPVRETGEEDAEKKKRKKKKKKQQQLAAAAAAADGTAASSSPPCEASPSLGSIDETAPGPCGLRCPLLLHECRRKNRECALHGQKKLTKEYRHKMKKTVARYVRPRIHGTYVPTSTGLSVGDMADSPFSSEWEDIFAPEDNWRRKTWGESAKLLAVKVILGADVPDRMEDDGSMSFKLNRPIGGHGTTYVDVLYLDRDTRITKGNAGSVFVQVRESASMPRTSTVRQKARRCGAKATAA